MKGARVWLAALVAVFALIVASCADEDGEGETAATGPTGGTTETGATGATGFPEFTTLEEGVLTVGSCLDYSPFEVVVRGDEIGFDIDLTEAIAERLGLTVEWVRSDFVGIFVQVAGGSFDMVAAASTITDEREEKVDFSDPYFNALQSLTVNTGQTPDITSTDQLGEGDVVNVQKGTTGEIWATENLEPQGVEIRAFTSSTDSFRDLEAGNATGVINDYDASLGIIADLPALEVVQQIDTDEHYGFAFSPSNLELREAWNLALAQVIADGTYAEIYNDCLKPNGEPCFTPGSLPPEFEPTA